MTQAVEKGGVQINAAKSMSNRVHQKKKSWAAEGIETLRFNTRITFKPYLEKITSKATKADLLAKRGAKDPLVGPEPTFGVSLHAGKSEDYGKRN